jgi:hypothetical protein
LAQLIRQPIADSSRFEPAPGCDLEPAQPAALRSSQVPWISALRSSVPSLAEFSVAGVLRTSAQRKHGRAIQGAGLRYFRGSALNKTI